ncbi:hypothetical protein QVD99_005865 [Batrachochytrium dendrobatidis]|nr:hypothetical protein O5D80_006054 [Batrachochytrium dendrobatidis]KAK5667250.1 hypothetical protein QVD99_005865 [Batrachochytrium dendrobatidis]
MAPKRQLSNDTCALVESDLENNAQSTDTIKDSDLQSKKPKTQKTPKPDSDAGQITIKPTGDLLLNIGGKNRLTVSKWNNKVLVGIREYYTKDGQEKPGAKGIALSPASWKMIKENADLIDKTIASLE